MPAYGAKSSSLTRADRRPPAFQQTSTWESRADFERYWFSDEIADAREAAFDLYNKPVYPVWHVLLAAERD